MLDSPYNTKNVREFVAGNHAIQPKIYPLQNGFRKRGQSGIEVSDWWSNVGGCIDDIAVVRSMWTTDNDHGAQLQFHTGRHALEGPFPTIGSWIHYGTWFVERRPAQLRGPWQSPGRLLRWNGGARQQLSWP